ncbi:hypothetical protein [Roseateles sp.]|uniref:hypothetical protein n=1 Tax=Roseateles sp. TaxID=1971397 RepID=UPI0039EAB79F
MQHRPICSARACAFPSRIIESPPVEELRRLVYAPGITRHKPARHASPSCRLDAIRADDEALTGLQATLGAG